MRRIALISIAVATWVVTDVSAAPPAESSEPAAAPVYGIRIPSGYRDWTVISVATVGGAQNDLRVKLGNSIAVKAYREGKSPFPDGAIIARLAYQRTASEENNRAIRPVAEKILGKEGADRIEAESFVAGPATNVQFMVKDSKRYASTGGWGFAQFTNGKPDGEELHKTCFACHAPAKDRDFVFTRYSP
jgi:hypothetical protein